MASEGSLTLKINFKGTLEKAVKNAFKNELVIAEKKWQTSLTEEEKKIIFHHSMGQLKMKCKFFNLMTEDFEEFTLKLPLKKGEYSLELPGSDSSKLDKYILFTRKGWIVEDHKTEENVDLKGLTDFVKEKILSWGRTAVFYGVGSHNGKK